MVFDSFDARVSPILWGWHRSTAAHLRGEWSPIAWSNPLFDLWETCLPAQEDGRSISTVRPLAGGQRKKVTLNPVSRFETISADGSGWSPKLPLAARM